MPTEQELLAMCLRWLQHPQGDAFDKAMLIAAVKAKLYPPSRPWVELTDKEIESLASWWPSYDQMPALKVLIKDITNSLKEKNT
jgi:hypothetical protein